MRLSLSGCVAVGALLLAGGAEAQTRPPGMNDPATPPLQAVAQPNAAALDRTDTQFMQRTAQGANYEINLAKVAAQKAGTQAVKSYAETIITDHARLGAEMQSVAAQHRQQLPSEMSSDDQTRLDHMKGLSGKDFDAAFMASEQKTNAEDVADERKEIASTRDPGVKQLAQDLAAADSKHLELSKALKAAT